MQNKDLLQDKLDYFQSLQAKEIIFNSEHLAQAYEDQRHDQSLAIKIFSVLGAVFACGTFTAFLFMINFFQTAFGFIGTGIVFLISAFVIDKVGKRIFLDSISLCLFLLGIGLVAFGFDRLDIHATLAAFSLFLISLGSMVISRGYIINFSATLLAIWFGFALFMDGEDQEWFYVLTGILGLLATYFLWNESKLISFSKGMAHRYLPIRTAVTLAFLVALYPVSRFTSLDYTSAYRIILSLVFIGLILYILSEIFRRMGYGSKKQRLGILLVLLFCLASTVIFPGISGALLISLICFHIHYKTGFVAGMIAFLYYLGQYYYDLEFTLLFKSLLMMGSGILFLALFFITRKKLENHEKL
ncbi:DUF4401 domain-containing protein [Sphingobacterium sp. CZ-2]|uniref:DUF4401 domain-containing protein n=1 Tax=Sphingobacterium sp. CZ-2 TaxID=2557994 RepID=UPI00106FA912|nr:DUF4401 domain-containing protein [Sphingobacterium sp. CZ-2]QBR13331.1 DUF4401 domain-containing protein [Sphingobacterium sp. CZ-2]